MAAKEKEKVGKHGSFASEDYEPIVIDKWDGSAVKNALDDMIKQIIKTEYGYVEDNKIVDIRLFLCTVACAFSIFAVVYDYLFPFPVSSVILAVCSISYFILMGIVTLFSMYVEGNIFMVAREKNVAGVGPDTVWTLTSTLPRFSDRYTLGLECNVGGTKPTTTASFEKSIGSWFTKDGELVVEALYNDLDSLRAEILKKAN